MAKDRNRKAAEKRILDFLKMWKGGKHMVPLYEDMFKRLNDTQFDAMMEDYGAKRDYIRSVIPNSDELKLTVEDNIEAAKKIGHSFFERCWLIDEQTRHEYLPTHKFLTVALPLKNQIQLLFKKLSVAKDNKSIDMLSGQVTGDSKGGGISKPEAQVFYSLGAEEILKEVLKGRGGDRQTQINFDRSIHETGSGDIDKAMSAGGKVQSRVVLGMLLKAQCIDNDLS